MKQFVLSGFAILFLLAGCTGMGKTATPLPTISLDSTGQTQSQPTPGSTPESGLAANLATSGAGLRQQV
jgi:nitrous oxide reductase accessory protein NosL